MVPRISSIAASLVAVATAFMSAGPASADQGQTGGLSAPERPHIAALSCASDPSSTRCHRGEVLDVRGEHLSAVRTVVFLGRAGSRDDRRARPLKTSEAELSVPVPAGARSGPVRALAAVVGPSAPSPVAVRVAPGTPATSSAPPSTATAADGVFPIQGKHDLGQSDANRFGGGRGHQGQDMFAACGTPLVAVRPARVARVATQSRAGNYVVLDDDATGVSYVYMHMAQPSPLRRGQQVDAGQVVGQVGDTGRATGCHLHFELWTAPGWYRGGRAIDPLPQLRLWDTAPAGS